jgi:uncharacterized protein YydD (DUF2326 family)
VSPFITWKLKNASDERAIRTALRKERRDEIKRLYTDIVVLFEQTIKQVLNKEETVKRLDRLSISLPDFSI